MRSPTLPRKVPPSSCLVLTLTLETVAKGFVDEDPCRIPFKQRRAVEGRHDRGLGQRSQFVQQDSEVLFHLGQRGNLLRSPGVINQ